MIQPTSFHAVRSMAMRLTACAGLLLLTSAIWAAENEPLTVHKRLRVEEGGAYVVRERVEKWTPKQTAIIVCDMWDAHHCLNAVRRVEEMAPRMNQVLEKARGQGVLIIRSLSSCRTPYY